MKKLSAIILSLVIAFSVTACSSGNNEESKPVESKIAETETTESVNIKENMDSVLEHKKFEGIVYLTKIIRLFISRLQEKMKKETI